MPKFPSDENIPPVRLCSVPSSANSRGGGLGTFFGSGFGAQVRSPGDTRNFDKYPDSVEDPIGPVLDQRSKDLFNDF